MSHDRSVALDLAGYLVVRVAACVLRIMPYSLALVMVRALAYLAFQIDRRHRKVALDNLRHAFPGRYSEEELQRLVLGVYQHLGTMLFELIWLPSKFRPEGWRHLVTIPEALDRALDTCRPLLVVSAHYGSWEGAVYWLGLRGVKAHLVARSLDNPFLDRLIRRFRESTGHEVLSKKGDFDRVRRGLASGGVVCMLADQYAGSQAGLFVNFFGRPASTHKSVAVLAMRYRATIVVVGMERIGPPFHYATRMTDLIDPQDYVNDPDAIRSITERATLAVERLVLNDPKQYLWLHQRWRNSRAA